MLGFVFTIATFPTDAKESNDELKKQISDLPKEETTITGHHLVRRQMQMVKRLRDLLQKREERIGIEEKRIQLAHQVIAHEKKIVQDEREKIAYETQKSLDTVSAKIKDFEIMQREWSVEHTIYLWEQVKTLDSNTPLFL